MNSLSPREAARRLRRNARAATLATVAGGQPFATLVTPAPAPDGSLLLLLSGLSDHTAQLAQEPRCSLLMVAPAGADPNPQAHARLTLLGTAVPEPDPALRQRWIARHPYAAFYAGLGDFRVWRVHVHAGQYIGGFGSATRLVAADLTPDPAAVAMIAAAEAGIILHCNTDHAGAMDVLALQRGASGPGWRMSACDSDGCDLSDGTTVLRLDWPEPVTDPAGVRQNLMQMLRRTAL